MKGLNRSCCVLAAYLMRRYRWTLYKTLEFLHSRKNTLEIRTSFYNQLISLEAKLSKVGFGAKSHLWTDQSNDQDEMIIANTFLNSKNLPHFDYSKVDMSKGNCYIFVWKNLKKIFFCLRIKLQSEFCSKH